VFAQGEKRDTTLTSWMTMTMAWQVEKRGKTDGEGAS